jgi:hypothetical protein
MGEGATLRSLVLGAVATRFRVAAAPRTRHGDRRPIRGRLHLATATGDERQVANSVLSGGAELVARLFAGQAATPINRVNVGFGGDPLGPADIALRTNGVDPAVLRGSVAPGDATVAAVDDVVRVSITATFTPTVALDGVTEAGLSADDALYNQVLFDPVNLEAGQAVSFFWEIDFPFGH